MSVITLYNNIGSRVGESICYNASSDLVLGASSPLGDTHVVVHISKTHSEVDIPQDQVRTLVVWSIKLVHYRGAILHDHAARDNYN